MKFTYDKTLALAGILQAVKLVQELAYTGQIDNDAFAASIRSILTLDAATLNDIYGDIPTDLHLGLQTMITLLQTNKRETKDLELMRYLISLMVLERKLIENRQAMEKLGIGIERIQRQTESLSSTHPDILSGLAELYSTTISTLGPRIMVNGDPTHLKENENVVRIRALLLAGIRSAVLWRQKGGARWRLILNRSQLLREALRIFKKPT